MTARKITDHPDGRGITIHNADGSTTDASVDHSRNVTVRHADADGQVEMHGTAYRTGDGVADPTIVIRRRRT